MQGKNRDSFCIPFITKGLKEAFAKLPKNAA